MRNSITLAMEEWSSWSEALVEGNSYCLQYYWSAELSSGGGHLTKYFAHNLIFYRYSLLMHHTEEELREFGLTDDMLKDQEW